MINSEDIMSIARKAAAKFWSERSARDSRQCGKRDAEVILAGGADASADVVAARNAVLMTLAHLESQEAGQ